MAGPRSPSLDGDANRDRQVNVADLGDVAANWKHSPRTFGQGNFDYSSDGSVDIGDLGILASAWQKQLPAAALPTRLSPAATDRRLLWRGQPLHIRLAELA
jgi:hypothetical protein